ncbi:MAG: hypothetical protein K9J27_06430 [Bacteroidales bacterium]|nr:hypothetical protein [Bacteroidales bacterium]MCF8333645.1 hypothetical protein [Bacteroidales bacterium]
MRKHIILLLIPLFFMTSGKAKITGMEKQTITDETRKEAIHKLKDKFGTKKEFRIKRGVKQAASLWRSTEGTQEEFITFCMENFIPEGEKLDRMFDKVSRNMEILWGKFHEMDVLLKEPLHLAGPPVTDLDMMFGSFNPGAHLTEDLYRNKIGIMTALNFPYYTLEEKSKKGTGWSRKQWAYARLGDVFTSRVPADLKQEVSSTLTQADAYISDYNIYMGQLLNEEGKTPFPEDLKLIAHWGLRDELKSQYANDKNGPENQEMIYKVMLRIINQNIPQKVINSNKYKWNPYSNNLYQDGEKLAFERELDTRYKTLLKNFRVMKKEDTYHPHYENFIERKFEGDYEMAKNKVKSIFETFVSSPVIRDVGALISDRLGRDLRPYDIWYDGFKARSGVSEDKLDAILNEKYPTAESFNKDLPHILQNLGFDKEKSQEIASKIVVEPSRGAGHAWGAEMRSDASRLRTRIGEDGMNYKGYNIAIHEFGHNVEQTLTLQDVDYYMLNGVPNTAFTEALAFIFQKRDLQLMGTGGNNPDRNHLRALDKLWSCYEIMGVSLVDMRVWEWMYDHPEATPAELKESVTRIAKDVWNRYYADVFGVKDSPILAIYSHMIDNPLYLSAYPLGMLIDFQIEEQLNENNFAGEVQRIFTKGRLTPEVWMKEAVGDDISVDPLIKASEKAVEEL